MVLVSPSLRAFSTPKRIETVREKITGFLSVHRCIQDQMESAFTRPDSSRDVDGGRTRPLYKHFSDGSGAVSFDRLQKSGDGRISGLDK